ncbi:hypothetical protein FOCC_FOCC000171 [Frankliniella occidentalis]|uniref:RING-type E3 ubiquitin transferase n=1 Tax=Frankliniella occidentalis TaxID=133901 RepID=A0A6J1TI59_FRAOC|nr:uncharacterized protein LOC113217328 isoform X1 [Frankliniella occidentalis]XP_052127350.1 uncharacterized protein LOC113217328 isoform X1 [Frankliniella occidentalis]KAE8753249.1 hypothetical protein FOCC_FOCC000171 [Frankliniella occidentalis]
MVDVGPAGAASSGSSQNNSNNSGEEDKKDERMFECNICLDTAKDAVISMCGHLFCWPCLHQWLETRPARQMCPVCKAAISKEKVIPLYGRGSSKQEDPRNKAPPRPAGQRTEPEANATEEDQWWTDEESSESEFEASFTDSDTFNSIAGEALLSLGFILNSHQDEDVVFEDTSSFFFDDISSGASNLSSNDSFVEIIDTSMSEDSRESESQGGESGEEESDIADNDAEECEISCDSADSAEGTAEEGSGNDQSNESVELFSDCSSC